MESLIRQDLISLEDLIHLRGQGLQQLLAQSNAQILNWSLKMAQECTQFYGN